MPNSFIVHGNVVFSGGFEYGCTEGDSAGTVNREGPTEGGFAGTGIGICMDFISDLGT